MTGSPWFVDGLIILLLLACSFFFSGSETALTAISRARIYKLVKEGNKRARLVEKLRERKDETISTILLANNVVNIVATTLTTTLAIKLFGADALVYVTAVLTVVLIIFSEILPKTIAIRHSERVALFGAGLISLTVRLFLPFTKAIQWIIRRLFRLFGSDIDKTSSFVDAADVIRGTIELHHREGEVIKHERDMLGSILDLGDLDVSEVMVHRKHIETVDFDLPAEEIVRRVTRSVHSRMPFWKDNPDNIIGILHVRDLFRAITNSEQDLTHEQIERLLIKPWFIPETTTLREQLLAFRLRRRHFAVVVDEYGALLGIVTLEDIIEEIVGEIDDEHDRVVGAEVMALGNGVYHVTGTTSVRDLNRHLDWDLPDEQAATIGGLVIHAARTIPEAGAEFSFFGYHFHIEEKRANQVLSLRIRRQPREEEEL